ncbi:unnamed protein product, partial [Symbiodinium pilosum]
VFEMSIEESVKAYLREELFPTYDPSFVSAAVTDRMASWRTLEKEKQTRGDAEVPPPGDPPTDPATLLAEYGEPGPGGVPTVDAEGKPLDKKKLAALKKDLALLQKPWDKWQKDKKKYEAYLLSNIRKQCLEKYAEVQYTEEVEHLRPLSPTSRTPLVVVVEEVPEDPNRAVWSDEIEQVSGQRLDPKVRKDKNVSKKLKGLEDRCFKSANVHDPLLNKLMALSDDQQIWEGVKIQVSKKSAKMKAPKEPKEPKGLVDPAEHFKSGKHDGKFGAFDDKGVPTQTADGTEIPDKKLKGLQKEYNTVKDKWDKYQEALAKYNRDLAKYERWKEGGDEETSASGVPEAQRSAACETAALEVLRRLVDRAVSEHAEELALEVNKGSHDPAELASLMVKVVLEHEDKTTDPVLKVLKTVDKKKRSGMTEVGELPEVFRLLKEDELQVGTHVCFGDITEEEISFISSSLQDSSLVRDGQIPHEDLKTFIEGQNLQPATDGKPSSLAGTLVAMRLESWKKASSVEKLMSPRAWRLQLSGGSLPLGVEAPQEEAPEETNEAPEPAPAADEKGGKEKDKEAASLQELIADLTLSRAGILKAMAFCVDKSMSSLAIAQRICASITEEQPGLTTQQLVARLFLLNDVLYNSHCTKPGASQYRRQFQELLPDVLERIREVCDSISTIASSALHDRALKLVENWSEWALFPPRFTKGLEAVLCGKADTAGEQVSSSAPPAVQQAQQQWLGMADLATLERACRQRGLSIKGNRQRMVERLCLFEAYWPPDIGQSMEPKLPKDLGRDGKIEPGLDGDAADDVGEEFRWPTHELTVPLFPQGPPPTASINNLGVMPDPKRAKRDKEAKKDKKDQKKDQAKEADKSNKETAKPSKEPGRKEPKQAKEAKAPKEEPQTTDKAKSPEEVRREKLRQVEAEVERYRQQLEKQRYDSEVVQMKCDRRRMELLEAAAHE